MLWMRHLLEHVADVYGSFTVRYRSDLYEVSNEECKCCVSPL